MASEPRPIKVADLPPPPRLSTHDMQRADAESSRWRADVMRGTATLERLAAADLQIILR